MAVGTSPQWRSVIGFYQDSAIRISLESFKHRPHDFRVDFLDCTDLGIHPTFMGCLVWRLNMNANDIMAGQGLDPVSALGGVIGVQIPSRSGYIDTMPADQLSNPRTKSTALMIAPFLPNRS